MVQADKVTCAHCDGGGWMWPNLGVNCPAGSAVSVAGAQAFHRACYGADYYIPCPVCNFDEHKPHPQQDKIDAAKEIQRQSTVSGLGRAIQAVIEFDGSNIVDRWSKDRRKYRFRKNK